MKRLLFLLFFLASSASALTFDSGGDGLSATSDLSIDDLAIGGNTTLGNASADTVTQNAATVSFPNDTITTLGGGASGWTIRGDVLVASNTVVDAYSDSFGAVTAGSTSTVTWTEVTDRLGEFVTSSFTVTLAGFYEIIAHAGVSQTAGSACFVLKVNGTSPAGASSCNQGVTGLASILDTSFTRILSLAVNDIVRMDASATTANATFQKLSLTIRRVN